MKELTFNLVEDHEEGITFGYYKEYSDGTKIDITEKKFNRLYKKHGTLFSIPVKDTKKYCRCKHTLIMWVGSDTNGRQGLGIGIPTCTNCNKEIRTK